MMADGAEQRGEDGKRLNEQGGRGRETEAGGMARAGLLSMCLSVHHSEREDGFMASEIHPRRGGLHSEYKYMWVCRGQGRSWQANSC